MLFVMSKLLEQVIQQLRELPEVEQDIAAAGLIRLLAEQPTDEDQLAIEQGRRAYQRGHFVSLAAWRHEMEFGNS